MKKLIFIVFIPLIYFSCRTIVLPQFEDLESLIATENYVYVFIDNPISGRLSSTIVTDQKAILEILLFMNTPRTIRATRKEFIDFIADRGGVFLYFYESATMPYREFAVFDLSPGVRELGYALTLTKSEYNQTIYTSVFYSERIEVIEGQNLFLVITPGGIEEISEDQALERLKKATGYGFVRENVPQYDFVDINKRYGVIDK
jgi:hypothetical protein